MKSLYDYTNEQIRYKNFSEEVRLIKETKAGASYSKYTCTNKNGITFYEVPGLIGLTGAAVMGYVNGDRARPVIIGPATKPTVVKSSFGLWYGNRAVFAGGYDNATIFGMIEYVSIPSLASTASFGNLTVARFKAASCSNAARAVTAGGTTPSVSSVIDYITVATLGNSSNFGSLIDGRTGMSACSNSIRGVFASYKVSANKNMEYVTLASTGNSASFGDMVENVFDRAGASNGSRGIFAGGITEAPGNVNTGAIEYLNIASVGNSQDFGDLQGSARSGLAGIGNAIYALFAGGGTPSPAYYSYISYLAIASLGNAGNFGNLQAAKVGVVGAHNATRALWAGGTSGANTAVIEYTQISTSGTSANFGNLSAAKYHAAGTSGD